MALLETQELSKKFGGVWAVNRINMKIEKHELTSIIGPNGAGKTTLFNLLSGNLPPSSGKILFDREEITFFPPHEIWYRGLSRSFQITNLFPALSVFENIQLVQMTRRKKQLDLLRSAADLYKEETYEILEAIELTDKANMIASFLPYGDQRKLEIGIVLASDSKMMLLDEPTAGMNSQETFIGKLFHERGLTILFIEHDMDIVLSISQRIRVMHQGRIIAEGTSDEISNNEEVRRIYLGEG